MASFIDDLTPWPEDDFSAFGQIELRKRSRLQQLVGRFLGRNWIRIPHVTHNDDIDVTDLEARRAAWNAEHPDRKLSALMPVVRAVALALKDFPQFAASLNDAGDMLVEKHYAHIGIAVDVPGGLLVPVLRDCDTRSLSDLAGDLAGLAEKARTKGLSMSEMSGGVISISSLGHIGGTSFTPIVNAPEVAILGLTKQRDVPVRGPGDTVLWRRVLPASLSYDHRVINGADAARFLNAVGGYLAEARFD